jgi:mono/diheme cytochrome c family protein
MKPRPLAAVVLLCGLGCARHVPLPAAGGVLGVNTRQLNRGDQLAAWARLGLFDDPPADAADLPRLAAADSGRSVEDRARSYLDANCAYCHRPGGAVTEFDARYDTPPGRQGLVGAPARINFGIDRARVIAPNDPWRSVALVRMATPEQTRMPPLGHAVADQRGLELLAAWVRSLPGPPVVAPPTVAPGGGDFPRPVRVELRHPDPAAVVRYTLDGSAPTAASPAWAGPLELTASATVRARAYRPGHTPSVTVQETFIVGE